MSPLRSRARIAEALLAASPLLLMMLACISERQDPHGSETDTEQLEALPYLTWVASEDDIDRRGVTYHDSSRSSPGLNLYSPRNLSKAILFDLEGNEVHSWSAKVAPGDTWQHVELLTDGELFALGTERRLLKLDARSQILWSLDLAFHHDLAVAEDGRIYSLIREVRAVHRHGRDVRIIDDLLVTVSRQGELVDRISVFDLFGDLVPESRWEAIEAWVAKPEIREELQALEAAGKFPLPHGTPPDVLHTNTVEIVTRQIPGVCDLGDLLISIRELDLIAVVDLEPLSVVWSWGPGIIRRQHQPTLLENGHILIFDNKGAGKNVSRIVELDPVRGEIVWEYRANPPEAFFSGLRGGSQRLPNGNTLITESDRGRVFEVTSDGTLVWEYFVPYVKRREKSRASVYRMNRLPLSARDLPWIASPSSAPAS